MGKTKGAPCSPQSRRAANAVEGGILSTTSALGRAARFSRSTAQGISGWLQRRYGLDRRERMVVYGLAAGVPLAVLASPLLGVGIIGAMSFPACKRFLGQRRAFASEEGLEDMEQATSGYKQQAEEALGSPDVQELQAQVQNLAQGLHILIESQRNLHQNMQALVEAEVNQRLAAMGQPPVVQNNESTAPEPSAADGFVPIYDHHDQASSDEYKTLFKKAVHDYVIAKGEGREVSPDAEARIVRATNDNDLRELGPDLNIGWLADLADMEDDREKSHPDLKMHDVSSAQDATLTVESVQAKKIFSGAETHILKSGSINVGPGSTLPIYVKAPARRIEGTVIAGEVVSGTPDHVWAQIKDQTPMSRRAFNKQCSETMQKGSSIVTAVRISSTGELETPISLKDSGLKRHDVVGVSYMNVVKKPHCGDFMGRLYAAKATVKSRDYRLDTSRSAPSGSGSSENKSASNDKKKTPAEKPKKAPAKKAPQTQQPAPKKAPAKKAPQSQQQPVPTAANEPAAQVTADGKHNLSSLEQMFA